MIDPKNLEMALRIAATTSGLSASDVQIGQLVTAVLMAERMSAPAAAPPQSTDNQLAYGAQARLGIAEPVSVAKPPLMPGFIQEVQPEPGGNLVVLAKTIPDDVDALCMRSQAPPVIQNPAPAAQPEQVVVDLDILFGRVEAEAPASFTIDYGGGRVITMRRKVKKLEGTGVQLKYLADGAPDSVPIASSQPASGPAFEMSSSMAVQDVITDINPEPVAAVVESLKREAYAFYSPRSATVEATPPPKPPPGFNTKNAVGAWLPPDSEDERRMIGR